MTRKRKKLVISQYNYKDWPRIVNCRNICTLSICFSSLGYGYLLSFLIVCLLLCGIFLAKYRLDKDKLQKSCYILISSFFFLSGMYAVFFLLYWLGCNNGCYSRYIWGPILAFLFLVFVSLLITTTICNSLQIFKVPYQSYGQLGLSWYHDAPDSRFSLTFVFKFMIQSDSWSKYVSSTDGLSIAQPSHLALHNQQIIVFHLLKTLFTQGLDRQPIFFFFFFLKGWIIQVCILTSWQHLCIPDLGWLEWLFLSFVQSNDLKCSLQWHLEGLYTWRFVISRMSSVCLLCLVCDILQVSHNEMLHFQQMAWQAGKVPRQHFVVVQCTKERMAAHHAVLP